MIAQANKNNTQKYDKWQQNNDSFTLHNKLLNSQYHSLLDDGDLR